MGDREFGLAENDARLLLARGLRFAVMAWLLARYGEPIREFIEKRLGLIAAAGAMALIMLFVAFKLLRPA